MNNEKVDGWSKIRSVVNEFIKDKLEIPSWPFAFLLFFLFLLPFGVEKSFNVGIPIWFQALMGATIFLISWHFRNIFIYSEVIRKSFPRQRIDLVNFLREAVLACNIYQY